MVALGHDRGNFDCLAFPKAPWYQQLWRTNLPNAPHYNWLDYDDNTSSIACGYRRSSTQPNARMSSIDQCKIPTKLSNNIWKIMRTKWLLAMERPDIFKLISWIELSNQTFRGIIIPGLENAMRTCRRTSSQENEGNFNYNPMGTSPRTNCIHTATF